MKIDKRNIMPMSPLADPVFSAIYANADVAGLAMESFICAVLEADNETLVGKVTSVTPQQVQLQPNVAAAVLIFRQTQRKMSGL